MRKAIFLLAFCALLTFVTVTGLFLNVNVFIRAGLLAGALLWLYASAKLTKGDVGLTAVSRRAIVWALASVGLIFTTLGLIYSIAPDVFKDSRYNQELSQTFFAVFIALPLTTVFLEEFAFRGILLGYLLKTETRKRALIISSVLFGFWHFASSYDISVESLPLLGNPSRILISVMVVIVTGLAGFAFSLLRLKSKSLLVPIVAHWSLNAAGMLYAWLAWN